MAIQVIKSDGSKVLSQRISELRVSASTMIYIDNLHGNDTSGDGTSSKPYRTLTKGFSSIPTSPLWTITNPAYRVNASTGNDGTGGRFGGKFQTINGAKSHGSYTAGDIIYVEAGSYTLSANIGGVDIYCEDGVSVSYGGNVFQTSAAARDSAVAGKMALTLSNVNAQVGTFDDNRITYVQLKSITTPASYANHAFACTGTTSAAKAYVWVDSDYDHTSNGAVRIAYSSTNHAMQFRMRGIRFKGTAAFYNSGSGTCHVYCDSYTDTGTDVSANFFNQSSTGDLFVVCRGDINAVGGIITVGNTGNSTLYVNGNMISTGTSANVFYNGANSLVTIICGGTIRSGTSSNNVYSAVANAKFDITAKYIDNGPSSTNPPPIQLITSTSSAKLRNADIRGQNTASLFGAIKTTSGATLELYDCIVRSSATSSQPCIKEASAGSATVTYYGSCQLSDAVHASITEVNTANRSISSSLRY